MKHKTWGSLFRCKTNTSGACKVCKVIQGSFTWLNNTKVPYTKMPQIFSSSVFTQQQIELVLFHVSLPKQLRQVEPAIVDVTGIFAEYFVVNSANLNKN
jgi:hypothetical protein